MDAIREAIDVWRDVRGAWGDAGIIGALAVTSRYLVTIWRSRYLQWGLAWLEERLGLGVGTLVWSYWSPGAKRWWGLGTGLIVSVLGSVAAGMPWTTALVAGVVAAFGGKGAHDARALPIGRPAATEPSVGRGVGIRTRVPQPHLDEREPPGGGQ